MTLFLMVKMHVIKEEEGVKQLFSKLSRLIPVSALLLLPGKSSLASAAEPGHHPCLLCLLPESWAAPLLPGVPWLQEKFLWSDCHLLYQRGGPVLVSNWLTSALLHSSLQGDKHTQRSLTQPRLLSYVLLQTIQAVFWTMSKLEVTRLLRDGLLLKAAFGERVHFGLWRFIWRESEVATATHSPSDKQEFSTCRFLLSLIFLIMEFKSDGSGTELKSQVSKPLKQKGNTDANSHPQLSSADATPRVTCYLPFI